MPEPFKYDIPGEALIKALKISEQKASSHLESITSKAAATLKVSQVRRKFPP